MSFENKLRRSRALVREVSRRSGELPLIVNFSGGKDSMACLLLAQEASDRIECMYFDSGFELPMTLRYVRARAKELGIPLNVSHPERDKVGWYDFDFEILRRCDLLVMLPRWQESSGARLERCMAERDGIPVYVWECDSDRESLEHQGGECLLGEGKPPRWPR